MSFSKMSKLGSYFIEFISPTSWHVRGVRKIYYSEESKYQRIDVVEFEDLGRGLVLDGKVQSALYDEFIYHESLVHPALIAHGKPERVLIIGGGEGATAREALKHKSVREVIMVDLDEAVVNASKKYLPEMGADAFSDPRFKLVVGDGRKYVEAAWGEFDAIIIDATDPMEGGPASLLYTVEFYRAVKNAMRPGGVMVTQAANTSDALDVMASIHKTISTVFKVTRPYSAYVTSYDAPWGFIFASDSADPKAIPPSDVDSKIAANVKGSLKYYDGETHVHMFSLPKNVREAFASAKRIATDREPPSVRLPSEHPLG
ncbi:spermidine synthase [Thermocladium modestius]|uniref:Polyamine aminopropyltransferase n=1 Tax=Thermocladium modestius TaxID=62609 RepID=A0A830GTK9_9CREN|nr:polyamine aminopropyltransferase [Thermocladium modestius]GGP20916.1 spermidine synthase [Thermocladium modestius]